MISYQNELDELEEFKMNPKFREKLLEIGFIKSFEEGEVILKEKAYIKAIPIITKGRVKVTGTDSEGHHLLLYTIVAGESCVMSFLGGLHSDTSKITATAEEDTEILFIPTESLAYLNREFPEWLDYIFRLYHKRFEELLEVVNDLAFKKTDERLINLLKKKSELLESKEIPTTHEQLAEELGTARVVVSRLLKKMEEDQKIILGRNKITLV